MANISEDDLEEIKERFDMFDKKGDGKVEAFQIIDVLRSCGLNPLTADVEKMIIDSELANTRVELEKFCAIYEQVTAQPGQATYEDMMEAFKTFDRDSAGIISSAELRQILVNIGDSLTDAQADIIVAPHEDVDNGTVGYQQMIKTLMA